MFYYNEIRLKQIQQLLTVNNNGSSNRPITLNSRLQITSTSIK